MGHPAIKRELFYTTKPFLIGFMLNLMAVIVPRGNATGFE